MTTAKRNSKKQIQFNMAGGLASAEDSNDSAIIDSILSGLGVDEIIETQEDESTIKAAVADIEKAEARQALYEGDDVEAPEVAAADKPSEATGKKAKKVKAVKEPKAPRVTSITHAPGDRLVALLGGDKSFLVFHMTPGLESTEIEANAEAFISAMNTKGAIADKVKEKAIMLLTWLKSGKDASALNDVMKRAFSVLLADGEITSGKGGNLQTNLLAKPYSLGTSASQANQMFMLFPILGIATKEKGKMIANPDSTILALVKSKLA